MSLDEQSAYERWMQAEGIPVHTGYDVPDIRALRREPWERTGGKGCLVDLKGMEGFTNGILGEIAPGSALEPQKHLFQEMVYVLEGSGHVDVWAAGGGEKVRCDWRAGTLFAIPLNCWSQMVNDGPEPALYFAVTDAPLILDVFHDREFIYDNEHRFAQRFDGARDYFTRPDERLSSGRGVLWQANAIHDVPNAAVDALPVKGSDVKRTYLGMAEGSLTGHLGDEPVGKHGKAHHHVGGAVILMLRASGYTLMWPSELGVRPYEAGFGDRVVRIEWGPFSLFSPPTGWFHQHFNTSAEASREIAFRFGNALYHATRFHAGIPQAGGLPAFLVSYHQGGTLIPYEDEDPRVHRDYEEALRRQGLSCAMDHPSHRAA
jgi:quercetin dioxygenase-like cupin family protein